MAGFSNVSGDESIVFADNASFNGDSRSGKLSADGELWIGSTSSPHVVKGHIVGGSGVNVSNSSGSITITAGGSVPLSFTGNSGTATPVANNITLAGSSGVSTSASGGTVTFTASATVPLSFPTDSGTATPAANALTVTGGTGLNSSGSGSTVTINADATVPLSFAGDSGTATPALNSLTISGGTGLTSVGSGSTMTVNLDTPVSLANGGTNANLTASNGGVFYSTSTAGAILAGTATANQVLLSGSSTTPAWSTATYPATTTSQQLLYSSAANTVGGLAVTNNRALVSDNSGNISWGSSLAGDFTYTSSNSAVVRTLTVSNTSNSASTSGALVVASTGGSSAGDAWFEATTTTTPWSFGVDNSVTSPSADPFVISQATTLGTNNVMSITTSGAVSKPLQPCVFAYLASSALNVTGDGTIYTVLWDTELFDQGSNFNTGTSTFTAPVTGNYMVTIATQLLQLTASHTLIESKIVVAGTSANTYTLFSLSGTARDSNNNIIMTNSLLIPMTATDTLTTTMQATGGTKVVDIFGSVVGSSVSIFLVC